MNKAYLSPDGKRAMELAKTAAREYGIGHVGTEHLLLGISRAAGSCGSDILNSLGASEYHIKGKVDHLAQGKMQETWVAGRLPGTPHFKDVLNRAAQAARGNGNWQVGTEHLLLALSGEQDSMGARALRSLGIAHETLRKSIAELRKVVQ